MDFKGPTPDETFRSVADGMRRTNVNPYAIAALAVALLVPMAGWTMSLSNRVAVLEAQSMSLQTAAVEISALKQEITDFRNEFDSWKVETRTKPEYPPLDIPHIPAH